MDPDVCKTAATEVNVSMVNVFATILMVHTVKKSIVLISAVAKVFVIHRMELANVKMVSVVLIALKNHVSQQIVLDMVNALKKNPPTNQCVYVIKDLQASNVTLKSA
jgi:hypothetical protein